MKTKFQDSIWYFVGKLQITFADKLKMAFFLVMLRNSRIGAKFASVWETQLLVHLFICLST